MAGRKTQLKYSLAGDRGFEPRHTDPESAVLPLDESPERKAFYHKMRPWPESSITAWPEANSLDEGWMNVA